MGATSAGRNPQPNSLETETTEYPFFRRFDLYVEYNSKPARRLVLPNQFLHLLN